MSGFVNGLDKALSLAGISKRNGTRHTPTVPEKSEIFKQQLLRFVEVGARSYGLKGWQIGNILREMAERHGYK